MTLAVRLPLGYGHSARWWLNVTSAGIAVTVAFAVLAASAAAPASVRITGDVAGTGAERSYDLVVRGPAPAVPGDTQGWVTSPASLPTYSGGITLAQYETIRHLPGVAVAAPMTMVGYLPLTVQVPIGIPASAIRGAPRPVTLTVRLRSDNGLSTITWDDVTMASPGRATGRRHAVVSVPLSWTFLVPLVAVDPDAEARLLRLDAAVVSGRYLPATTATHSGPVPVLLAGSIADDEEADVSINTPAGRAVLGASALTATTAYSRLLGDARESAATVWTYWTASPVTYQQAPDGGLVPQPVAVDLAAVWGGPYLWGGAPGDAAVLDVTFRSLTQHATPAAGARVRAVGVFDPAKIASAPASPSPYLPTLLTGADARSRQLLGGRALSPNGAPGGYLDPAASLVIPLADIGAFTGGYAGTDDAAPIGVIRVRVAAPAGGAASLERIRAVADEIVRATGLRVDAVLAATATTRVINLPAGLHGRPPLRVDETWYRSGTSTTVAAGVDRQSIVLSELELLAAEVLIVNFVWQLLRARRRDVATLRALGWGRRQVGRQLLAEFALAATAAGVAAALGVYAAGTVLAGRPAWWWPLFGVPIAITMIFAAACWPLLRGGAEMPDWPPRVSRLSRWHRPGRLAIGRDPVRNLLRAPERTLFGGFLIALACATLGLELAVRWAFPGAAESWAGRSASLASIIANVTAVLVIVTMVTGVLAELDWVTAHERAAEVRTLRALGWSARDVARRKLSGAVRLGLAGGLVTGALVMLCGLAVAGTVPPRLVAAGFLVALAGVAVSLLATGLSVTWGQLHRSTDAGGD